MSGELSPKRLGESLTVVPEVLVPEFLGPGQNVFDQPPFSWLLADRRIFDEKVISDKGEQVFLWAMTAISIRQGWVKALRPGKDGSLLLSKTSRLGPVVEEIDKEYRNSGTIMYMYDQARKFLDQYPYWWEYLHNRMGAGKGDSRAIFDQEGKPILERLVGVQVRTYAAYVNGRLVAERGIKWVGLAEVLPDASAATDVVDALPAKGGPNRFFRLVRSEALK